MSYCGSEDRWCPDGNHQLQFTYCNSTGLRKAKGRHDNKKRKNTPNTLRLRRKESDAKWRANIALCYDALKYFSQKPRPVEVPTKTAKLAKIQVLQETAKKVCYLEEVLRILLVSNEERHHGQQAKGDSGESAINSHALLRDVQRKFAERHYKMAVRRKRGGPGYVSASVNRYTAARALFGNSQSEEEGEQEGVSGSRNTSRRKTSDVNAHVGLQKGRSNGKQKKNGDKRRIKRGGARFTATSRRGKHSADCQTTESSVKVPQTSSSGYRRNRFTTNSEIAQPHRNCDRTGEAGKISLHSNHHHHGSQYIQYIAGRGDGMVSFHSNHSSLLDLDGIEDDLFWTVNETQDSVLLDEAAKLVCQEDPSCLFTSGDEDFECSADRDRIHTTSFSSSSDPTSSSLLLEGSSNEGQRHAVGDWEISGATRRCDLYLSSSVPGGYIGPPGRAIGDDGEKDQCVPGQDTVEEVMFHMDPEPVQIEDFHYDDSHPMKEKYSQLERNPMLSQVSAHLQNLSGWAGRPLFSSTQTGTHYRGSQDQPPSPWKPIQFETDDFKGIEYFPIIDDVY